MFNWGIAILSMDSSRVPFPALPMKATFINNLRFKTALVFLLVSLVPLGIVSVFAVRTSHRAIASIVANQLENLAAQKQDLLERWITERNADLRVVAGSAAVESLDHKQIAPYLKLVQDQYKVYKRFVVTATDGRVVYGSDSDEATDVRSEAWYQRVKEESPRCPKSAWRKAARIPCSCWPCRSSTPRGDPRAESARRSTRGRLSPAC